MNDRIKLILLHPKAKIREVMEVIQKAPKHQIGPAPAGIVLIVDKDRKLLGVITDGDIRRAILGGHDLSKPAEFIMKRNPITVPHHLSPDEMMRVITREVEVRKIADHRIDKVVVVDDRGGVVDVVSFFELWKNGEVKTKNVCVVGLGYVGLTLALTLADVGFKVLGVDVDERVVNTLKKGQPHFHEVGLDTLLKHHLHNNFQIDTKISSSKHDIYVLAVNTPIKNKKVVTSYLASALTQVAKVLKPQDLVILRSTVPVGTTRGIAQKIIESVSGLKVGEQVYLAFAPERTLEGKALEELRTLPQIVGGVNKASQEAASRLFKSITPVIVPVPSLEAAEMVKLLNNTFRDLSFAYANDVAQIAEGFDLNISEVIKAANNGYPRDKIPTPSPGVGGSCLTKDPYILIASANRVGYQSKLPALGREINGRMIDYVVRKVNEFARANKKNKLKVLVLGMAFKGEPETSDIRFSTAVEIASKLKLKHSIKVYDAVVPKTDLRRAGFTPVSLKDGFKGADCVLILNNHRSFRELDIYSLLSLTSKPSLFFDCWNVFSAETIKNAEGVKYLAFGLK